MSGESIKFKWAVQALALDYDAQVGLYPSFVEVPDELALEFEEALENYLGSGAEKDFDSAQIDCIAKLDQALESISGPANSRFWTMESLQSDPRWAEIRELAAATLFVFGWEIEKPPDNRGSIFIGPQDL